MAMAMQRHTEVERTFKLKGTEKKSGIANVQHFGCGPIQIRKSMRVNILQSLTTAKFGSDAFGVQ
jgi:hypothetical protein